MEARKIGSGAFSDVYKVDDGDEAVVVKVSPEPFSIFSLSQYLSLYNLNPSGEMQVIYENERVQVLLVPARFVCLYDGKIAAMVQSLVESNAKDVVEEVKLTREGIDVLSRDPNSPYSPEEEKITVEYENKKLDLFDFRPCNTVARREDGKIQLYFFDPLFKDCNEYSRYFWCSDCDLRDLLPSNEIKCYEIAECIVKGKEIEVGEKRLRKYVEELVLKS